MKKDKGHGANANLNLGYAVGQVSQYNTSVNGNFRNKALNAFGTFGYSNGNNINFMNLYREQRGFVLNQVGDSGGGWTSYNFKGGIDFFLNKENTLGFMVNGGIGDNSWNSRSRTEIGRIGHSAVDSLLVARSETNGDRNNVNFNLNYRLEKKNGTSLNIDADYGFFRNETGEFQPNTYMTPDENTVLSQRINQTRMPTDIDILTFKTDYERPFLQGQLGAGVKFSYVQTDNTFDFFNLIDGDKVLNTDRSNNFVYEENVNAAYVNYSRKVNDQLNFQLGLRTEQTNSTGTLTAMKPVDNEEVDRSYLDFFPSASINYAASEDHNLQLSYSRRLNRPSYGDLNPFQNQLDELTFQQGNPFLQPEYSNVVQLRHSFKYKLNTTLSFSHSTDLITRQTDAADGKAAFITFLNLADQFDYSLNLAAPVSFTEWWSSYSSLTAYYRENKGDFGEGRQIDLSAKAFNIFSQQTIKLPRDISLEVSGWYNSPSLWGGNIEMDAMWSLDAGVQTKVLGGRGNVKLSISDIFRTNTWQGVTQFGPLYMNMRGGFDSRRFRVNFSYLLGNSKVKSVKRKAGLDEEQSRVNSGN